ncbi:MAG: histidine--tRNA ligase [Candidatus Firestonebacteria bacterium]|nr:histidine--tRNA ligase [Candidatus Firestonebacteria bacterium]
MKQNYPYRGVKGMKDVFPAEARHYRRLEDRARRLLESCGCGEIRTPLVEHTVLFERGVGQGTDIVNKEMFYVPAKDEEAGPDALRRMVLRPEATASVARAYVENEIDKTAPGVQRYFYLGPMFRYERPQKGRLRQFTQIGAEFLGSPSPGTDAEAIGVLWDFLQGLFLGDLTLLLNSVGCPACRPDYLTALQAFARTRVASLCEDCRARAEKNPLRLFDCKQPGCRTVMAGAPNIQDHLCHDCRAHQAQVLDFLQRIGVTPHLEHRLMRGLDYYTRTVFEVVSQNLGAQNAVAAGGRYDNLIAELEGPATPAVGWSAGVERLLELLPETAPEPWFDVFVVDPGPDLAATFAQVTQLRRQGVRVGLEFEARSVKALMKRADKTGARFTLFVAADHPAQVQLKDMTSGEQTGLAWDQVAVRVLGKHE